ncbi:hypothetical protein ACLOJK_008452 [Asimina triloba]
MEEEEQKEISVHLPESLVHEIIEFLPIKTAVCLSLLSRRFAALWKSTRRLTFDPQSLRIKDNYRPFGSDDELGYDPEDERMRLAGLVDHVITSHAAPVSTCLISLYQQNCQSDMARWMGLLSQRGIHELILTCYGPPIKPWEPGHQILFCDFPHGLFCCESLRMLELRKCGLGDAASFAGAANLTSLTLHAVILHDKLLHWVLENCPCLETFILRRCSGLGNVKIHSASLKGLEITQSDSARGWHSVDIDIPAATTLVIDVLRCRGGFDVAAPNLQFLYAQRSVEKEEKECEGRKRHSRNIDSLAKCFGLYGKIAIEVDLNNPREAIVVAFILRNCHCLQEVNIKIPEQAMDSSSQQQCLPYPANEFWKRRDSFDCVSYSMRTVKIRGITGQCLELEFVGYIIKVAAWLHKMEIQLGSSCTKEGAASTRQLLSLLRASLGAQILID